MPTKPGKTTLTASRDVNPPNGPAISSTLLIPSPATHSTSYIARDLHQLLTSMTLTVLGWIIWTVLLSSTSSIHLYGQPLAADTPQLLQRYVKQFNNCMFLFKTHFVVSQVGSFAPRPSEVAFNYAGQPIYTRGGLYPSKSLIGDLLNPSPSLPISAVTRDPFWWDSPLRPASIYNPWGKSPSFLRDSYLSPVKRTFLWDKHPIRPFGKSLLYCLTLIPRPMPNLTQSSAQLLCF